MEHCTRPRYAVRSTATRMVIPMMRGLVTIDPTNGEVSYNVDYYALAHASKFVKPEPIGFTRIPLGKEA